MIGSKWQAIEQASLLFNKPGHSGSECAHDTPSIAWRGDFKDNTITCPMYYHGLSRRNNPLDECHYSVFRQNFD